MTEEVEDLGIIMKKDKNEEFNVAAFELEAYDEEITALAEDIQQLANRRKELIERRKNLQDRRDDSPGATSPRERRHFLPDRRGTLSRSLRRP